jgi:hypothetical protein
MELVKSWLAFLLPMSPWSLTSLALRRNGCITQQMLELPASRVRSASHAMGISVLRAMSIRLCANVCLT